VKRRIPSQNPSKLATNSPKKTVITRGSNHFDDSAEDFVDENSTVSRRAKRKQTTLKFTHGNTQSTSENATKSFSPSKTSPKKLKSTEKSGHVKEQVTGATLNDTRTGNGDSKMSRNSGKSSEKKAEKEEPETDEDTSKHLKRPDGRSSKNSPRKNEMSPVVKLKDIKLRSSLDSPSKLQAESPRIRSISDSPTSDQSCDQSGAQRAGRKCQKTLYNNETAILSPSDVENSFIVSEKETDTFISPSSMFMSTSGVKKSPRYKQHVDSKTSSKGKSPRGKDTSRLDDSIDDSELEDDFDKELMKRVVMTSTQVVDDEGNLYTLLTEDQGPYCIFPVFHFVQKYLKNIMHRGKKL
jgi:hypothetical protein